MRLIAMGRAALAEGFALLGFETRVDATRDDVESVLAELIRTREHALVVLEHELARAETPNLGLLQLYFPDEFICCAVPAFDFPFRFRGISLGVQMPDTQFGAGHHTRGGSSQAQCQRG